MTGTAIVALASNAALVLFAAALLLTAARLVLGPTLPDRIVALDLMVGEVIGFIAAFALKSGFDGYLDIAVALGLIGFLATVAFARYVSHHAASEMAEEAFGEPQRHEEEQNR